MIIIGCSKIKPCFFYFLCANIIQIPFDGSWWRLMRHSMSKAFFGFRSLRFLSLLCWFTLWFCLFFFIRPFTIYGAIASRIKFGMFSWFLATIPSILSDWIMLCRIYTSTTLLFCIFIYLYTSIHVFIGWIVHMYSVYVYKLCTIYHKEKEKKNNLRSNLY